MSSAEDHQFMARAIRLARNGLYTCDPNPRVGCVLVKDGEIIGEGYHYRAGEPHAEPRALAVAGEHARGATAYVSLEPCCHHGRTPPCTEALIEAGVARVVVAMQDPNPLMAGKGLERLELAGVQVEHGLLESEAQALNPGFVKRMRTGLPYVRCKMAMSLDGRTAMASGESQWITSDAARRDVHRLRARSSAIITGIETVLADDPSLNVRLDMADLPEVRAAADMPQPLRVVLDSTLRMPPQSAMLDLPGEILVVCTRDNEAARSRLEQRGAKVVTMQDDEGRVDLQAVLEYLGAQEINEVLLEAGPTLAGSALQKGLVDELRIYMAPHLMGHEGSGLFSLPGLEKMQDRVALDIQDVRPVGKDWRITAVVSG
jgi:diaminohydroxyphosphoribosylaminopyrimidine deaminase/5-amino-6-(5-phosphoribosylamino)uracil reductase